MLLHENTKHSSTNQSWAESKKSSHPDLPYAQKALSSDRFFQARGDLFGFGSPIDRHNQPTCRKNCWPDSRIGSYFFQGRRLDIYFLYYLTIRTSDEFIITISSQLLFVIRWEYRHDQLSGRRFMEGLKPSTRRWKRRGSMIRSAMSNLSTRHHQIGREIKMKQFWIKVVAWIIIFSAISFLYYRRTGELTYFYTFLIIAPFGIPVSYLTRNWHPLRNFYNWAHRNGSDELTDSEESS